MSNAFKFTPLQGKISVEIKPIQDENGFLQKIHNEEEIETRKKDVLRSIMRKNDHDEIVSDMPEIPQVFDQYYVSFEIRIKDSGRGIA